MAWCSLPAGTSAHASLPRAALLLGLVLAVEVGGLLMTLALRPHISRVVTACEVVCSCLHVASTCMLLAAHRIAHGDTSAADSVMQVGGGLLLPTCLLCPASGVAASKAAGTC
jgi:hypothetical protein